MNSTESQALGEYADVLRRRYANRIDRIVLFGSQARGDARDGADVDVLVVVDRAGREIENDITDLAFDIMMKYAVDIEPAIFSHEEWTRMASAPTSFAYTVEREGRDL